MFISVWPPRRHFDSPKSYQSFALSNNNRKNGIVLRYVVDREYVLVCYDTYNTKEKETSVLYKFAHLFQLV